MDSGYMKQIRKRILAAEDGTTFATSDFADIADSATVRQSLNRLVQAGILQRVLRGIFVKPKFRAISRPWRRIWVARPRLRREGRTA